MEYSQTAKVNELPSDENTSGNGNLMRVDAAKPFMSVNKENLVFTVPVKSTKQTRTSKPVVVEKAVIVLAQFQPKSVLDFGTVKSERPQRGIFQLVNPLEEQEISVTLVKFPQSRDPSKPSDFKFDATRWNVPASGSVEVPVEWTPTSGGKIREVFEFEFTCKRRVVIQVQVLGDALGGKPAATLGNETHQGKPPARMRRSLRDEAKKPSGHNKTAPQLKSLSSKRHDVKSTSENCQQRSNQDPKTQKTCTTAVPKPNKVIQPKSVSMSSRRSSGMGLKLSQRPKKMSLHRGATSTSTNNKLVHYDARWQEKQERGFSNWINFIIEASVSPTVGGAEVNSSDEVIDIDGLTEAPSRVNAHAVLAQKQREASVRRKAFSLYHSEDLECVMLNVEKEVAGKRLVVRHDRQMFKDLGLRSHVLKILMAYEPSWLKMGLETVFGETIFLGAQPKDEGRVVLRKFLVERLLSDPEITARFRDTKRGVFENKEYSQAMQRFTLNKFLNLVAFLDQAKLHGIVEYPNCLFNPDEKHNPLKLKSSAQVVVEFAKEFLSGEGNVLKHLSHSCGFDLFHKQTPLDEFNFLVTNLAVDLRDGIRLTRMVEILTNDTNRVLSSRLRLPAVSRLQKLHNISLALEKLDACGVDLSTGRRGKITNVDIADGSRDKTLALLWRMIVKWRLTALVSTAELNDEIEKVSKLHGPTARRIMASAVKDMEAERDVRAAAHLVSEGDSMGNESNAGLSEVEELLLRWCQVVCAHHGGHVSNFTTSMATGHNLCLLVHHYHPKLLELSAIHKTTLDLTAHASPEHRQDASQYKPVKVDHSEFKEALKGERENFKLVNNCAAALGCVPILLPDFDSKNVPEPKLMSVFVAYLCARLFDSRKEIHAAMVIQKHWLLYYYKKHAAEKGAAIRLVQSFVRGWIARRKLRDIKVKLEEERMEKFHTAATTMSSFARMVLVPRKLVLSRWAAVAHVQSYSIRKRIFRSQGARQVMQQRAAIAIQTWVRVLRDQDNYLKVRFAVHNLHHFVRGWQVRQSYLAMRASAVMVQAVVRGHQARECSHRLRAVVRLQSWVRGLRANSVAKTRIRAIITIQAAERTRQMKRLFAFASRGVTLFQAQIRGIIARNAYLRFIQSAKRIQSVARLFLSRRNNAATCVQQVVRMWQAKSRFMQVRHKVVLIQAQHRALVATKHFRGFKRATIMLQTAVRVQLACKQTVVRKQSVAILHRFACQVLRKVRALKLRALLKIQSTVRMRQARADYQLHYDSIIKLQTFSRGVLVRILAKKLNTCATKIQSSWRAFRTHQKWSLQVQSIIRIQSFVRAVATRQRLITLTKAAIILQSFTRGQLHRTCFLRDRRDVVVLQSIYRCHSASTRFFDFRMSVIVLQAHARRRVVQQSYRKYCAARSIQAQVRAHQVHRTFLTVGQSTRVVQSRVRGYLLRRDYVRFRAVVVKLQAHQRRRMASRIATRECAIREEAALVLQKCWRGRQTRCVLDMFHCAAVSLQKIVRGYQQERKYVTIRVSVIRLQATFRAYSARLYLARAIVATTRIQAVARCKLAATQFKYHIQVTTTIQAIARGYQARRLLHKQQSAAVVLQAYWRGVSQRQSFLDTLYVVTLLQSFARRRCVQREVVRMDRAAVVIQSAVRGALAVGELREYRYKTIILQSQIRGHLARVQFLRVQRAVVCVQSVFRMRQSVARVHVLRSIVKVQSFMRMSTQFFRYIEILRSTEVIQRNVRVHQARLAWIQTRGAAIRIQSFLRGSTARSEVAQERRARLERSAASTIQRAWTCAIVRQQVRLALNMLRQRRNAALVLQGWYKASRDRVRYLSIRRLVVRAQIGFREIQHQKKLAVLDIQRVVRGMLERRRVQHIVLAAPRIQACWRGYLVRQECDRKMNEARSRLAAATRDAVAAPEKRLGNRTAHALDWLLNSSSLADILTACMTLETSTRLSDVCCDVFSREHLGAPGVIFRLIKSCNRSEPHIRLLRVALALLTNCALLPRCTPSIFAVDESAEVLVDLLQIFRDRTVVFRPAVKLLYLLKKRCPDRAQELLYGNEELVKRLHSIHHIMKRKVDIDRRLTANQAGKSKAFEALCDSFRALSNIIGKSH